MALTLTLKDFQQDIVNLNKYQPQFRAVFGRSSFWLQKQQCLWVNVSTRLGHLNIAILFRFCTTMQTVLGSPGIRREQPFSKPATNWWNSHLSCELEGSNQTLQAIWLKKKYVDWLLKNLICLEGLIHSFIFLWGLLVKNVDHDFMITSIKRRNYETCESFAVIVTSFRHNNALPSQPSLLWATAVASPLMTSRKKSAGLLWVSQVYPVKWKLPSDTSCAHYGGVIKTSSSYQCLRSNPKRWVLDRDKPEHLKTKNDNVTFLGKYLLRW